MTTKVDTCQKSVVRTARFSQKEIKAAQARIKDIENLVAYAREDVVKERCSEMDRKVA